jgi:secreted PhoX family phosphatase
LRADGAAIEDGRAMEDRDGRGSGVSHPVSRRALLGATVAAGVGVAVTGTVAALFNGNGNGRGTGTGTGTGHGTGSPPGGVTGQMSGYGPLLPDPDGRLALPRDFRYRVLAQEGITVLESGEPSPSDPDGAAAFASPDGGIVLVCNHEIGDEGPHPVPHVDGLVYDPAARGGTTTIEIGPDGSPVRQYVSLAGTYDNCAGGRTPWETWLTCEETEKVLDRPHGYVFEVDPFDQRANLDPQPIKALGRFAHEAVVVDPEDHVLYMTEDAAKPNGLIYRYTPPPEALPLGKGSLRRLPRDAGSLGALRASTPAGQHVPDLSVATEIGTTYTVDWVEVPDRDAARRSVRRQFGDDEVTRARKLEGMWWGDGGAYIVSSFARASDGAATAHDGQVWFLDPRAGSLTLHLRFAPTDTPDLAPNGPDNITVSPYGGVVIAEDGKGRPHLLGATLAGTVFLLAQSEAEVDEAEFCGPVFSADERTLFVNLQGPGLTFAIEGPFVHQP